MLHHVANRSRDRRRRWALAIAYMTLLASCESPLAPDVTEVERLEVTPPVLTMSEGGEATLIARVYGPDDELLPAAHVFWSTQDRAVVTVNQVGLVTAVSAGTAQIAASSGGQSRTIAVTVSPRPIALVRISPPAGNVVVGQTLTLQGEALDGTGAIIANRSLEWASTAPTIATVNNAGVVTGVTVGQTTISATGEGKVGTSIVSVLPTAVASITIQPNGGTIPAGASLALTATPRDASGQPLAGRTIEWRSSSDAIATVSSLGLVTAISPGSVTVTASSPGAGPNGTTPTATVTVTVLIAPVASAVLLPSPTGVLVGRTVVLTLNLFDAGGEPLSTAGRTVTWSTSNAAVATVNSSGVVTGVAVGSATVTATVTTPGQPGTIQAAAQVAVSSQPVASVVVSPASGTVHVAYSRLFLGVARDSTGQTLPGRAFVWTSSNQAVATVDASTGLVTGVSQGNVEIRATSEGKQGVANVVIDLVPVSSVLVTPPTATMTPPQTIQLVALPRDSAGTTIQGPALGGRTTTWASATPSAATVSASGVVTAVAQGASIVTATIGGIPGQSSITVSPLPSASQLAIVTQPSASTPNDAAFPVQPAIQLKDALGNNVSTAGVTIQAAITAPGTGALGGTTSAVTNASGTATFTGLRITGTTGPRTLTFTSGALTPVTSAGVNVQPGAPTQLALTTPPPPNANSGQVFSSPSVVQLRDISGNDVPQAGITVNATVQPGGTTLGGSSVTTSASGAATFGALTLTGPAGSYSLTFSSGGLTPVVSGSITLSAGSGSKLSITAQPPSSVPNGQPFGAVIQLLDGSNNPVAQAGVNVSVAIETGNPALSGTTVATTNGAGVANFSNLILTGTTGARTLLFGAAGFTAISSNAINLTPGAAAALAITSQPPSSAQSGAVFAVQPSVQLRDISGNDVAQGGVSITVSLIGSGASLIGSNSTTTGVSGAASFSGLGISGLVGTYSLSFATAGIPPESSGNITLLPGPAAQLSITTQPAGAASGSAFSTQPVVLVTDAQTNPVAGVTVTASVTSGSGNLVGTATAISNAAGNAAFSDLGLIGTVGSYTVQFSSPPVPGVTSSLTLAPGAPALLTIQAQPAGAASGTAFGTQPVIAVRDAQSNPVTTAGLTISASANGGATLVGSGTAQTNSSGIATFSGLGLSGPVGTYTLDFMLSGVPNVTSSPIALASGAATQLSISTQPGSPVTTGSTLPTQPTVQLRDAGGNPVSQAGVNVTASISAGGATLTGTATVATDGSGLATFSDLGVSGSVGTYTITFSATGLNGAASVPISVVASTATQLTITTAPSGATSGAAFTTQPAIQVRDAQGNPVATAGVTVTATVASGGGSLVGSGTATTDGSGLATFAGLGLSGTVGSHTITFSSGALTPVTTGPIALSPGAAALLTIQTQPGGAISGSAMTTQPAILVQDAQSNPVLAGVTVGASLNGAGASLIGSTTASTDAAGVATFSGLGLSGLVGTYTLTFSAGAPSVTSGSISLAAGAATQLAVSAQPPASVANASQFGSSVQLRDNAGNAVSQAGVNVTVGLIGAGAALSGTTTVATDLAGVAAFTPLAITGTAGNYQLAFSSGSLTGATSNTITLTAGAATQLTITTSPPGSAVSGTPFASSPSVQLRDQFNNAVNQPGVQVDATLTGSGGSFIGSATANTDANGLATFPGLGITATAPGNFTIGFSSGSLAGASSGTIAVSVPATQLAVTTQPSGTASSGTAFSVQPSVQLLSSGGSPVSQAGVQVSVAITGGGATLLGTAAATTDGFGIATFTGLGIAGPIGSYTLTFSGSGLTSVVSASILLGAGAATQLVIIQQPGGAASGAPLSPQPSVQLRDAQGNNVSTAGVTVTAAIQTGPGSATLQGASASTDASGLASFSSLAITGPGNNQVYTLRFSATGLTAAISGQITIP
jgi:uncharacterized protein YjdB